MIRAWMEAEHPAVRELAKIRDVDYIDLRAGFRPGRTVLLAALFAVSGTLFACIRDGNGSPMNHLH